MIAFALHVWSASLIPSLQYSPLHKLSFLGLGQCFYSNIFGWHDYDLHVIYYATVINFIFCCRTEGRPLSLMIQLVDLQA